MSILSVAIGATGVKSVSATGAKDVINNNFMFRGQQQLPQAPQETNMSAPLVPTVPAPLVPKVLDGARRC